MGTRLWNHLTNTGNPPSLIPGIIKINEVRIITFCFYYSCLNLAKFALFQSHKPRPCSELPRNVEVGQNFSLGQLHLGAGHVSGKCEKRERPSHFGKGVFFKKNVYSCLRRQPLSGLWLLSLLLSPAC